MSHVLKGSAVLKNARPLVDAFLRAAGILETTRAASAYNNAGYMAAFSRP